ncbi:flagellar assembly protein FliW [Bacillus tianshenii]|uniref:flagellar assembly protein FliW n=1 Tax=Sutcliffiella tianshenii TaxID=1463404 RepID=UPI001CD32FBF|nr:flagellar assembly protein FliW [Bacillus tianshenii]MCA1320516.1 flagellar assembly protein FliW [Bacillus tianshenii]
MKIETKYHGVMEVAEQDIVTFANGIPGFNEEKQFTVIPFSEDGMFQILQSANTPELGFVITNPFAFFPDYDFKLEDQTVEALELNAPDDVEVFTVLTVQEPFTRTTANLQAPVVINRRENLGKQVILTGSSYLTKHKLFQEVEAK